MKHMRVGLITGTMFLAVAALLSQACGNGPTEVEKPQISVQRRAEDVEPEGGRTCCYTSGDACDSLDCGNSCSGYGGTGYKVVEDLLCYGNVCCHCQCVGSGP